MKKFIEARLDWMEKQFPPVPKLSINSAAQGWSGSLSATDGEIYFTLDGTDPRASDGEIAKAARAYGTPVPVKPKTKLFARVRQANRWGGPLVWTATSPMQ